MNKTEHSPASKFMEEKAREIAERIEANANLMLWCVHILGPDDVIAAPTHEAAVERAHELNLSIHERKHEPKELLCFAYAAPWLYDDNSHRENLKDWSSDLNMNDKQPTIPGQDACAPSRTSGNSERFRANVTAMVIKFCDGLLDRNEQLEARIAELEALAHQQDRRIDELMTDEALAQARIAELESVASACIPQDTFIRLRDWLSSEPPCAARNAFTAGIERQIAYTIECSGILEKLASIKAAQEASQEPQETPETPGAITDMK